eukprot:scaffold250_cov110-Isochrysis_galbana.AAC.6
MEKTADATHSGRGHHSPGPGFPGLRLVLLQSKGARKFARARGCSGTGSGVSKAPGFRGLEHGSQTKLRSNLSPLVSWLN